MRAITEVRPGKATRYVSRKWSPDLLKALVPEADGEPLDATQADLLKALVPECDGEPLCPTQDELFRKQAARIGSLRADPKL